MGAERWDEQVGSVADEATRLLESLRRSAETAAQSSARPGAADPSAAAPASEDRASDAGAREGSSAGATGPEPAAHDPFCTWCPLCRGAAVVRSLSPETLARLADLAALAATVLTDLAGSRTSGEQPASGRGAGAPVDDGDDRPERPRRPARPRRATPAPSNPIPISDADDPQEEPRG